MNETKQAMKSAFTLTIPIMCGYLFLGAGFGVLLAKSGYPFYWATFSAMTVYSGSMQYVEVDLLRGAFDLLTAVIMTVAVNVRHVFYGLSLIDKYKDLGAYKLYCIFGLTDETYSLMCMKTPEYIINKNKFYFFITLFDHLYWIAGCTLGAVIGQYIDFNAKGIDFVMTALFFVIFIEQWESTKVHIPALIGVFGSLLCLVLFRIFVQGGSQFFLIPAMATVFLSLTLGKKPIERRLSR